MTWPSASAWPVCDRYQLTHSGVANTPTKLDRLALKMAPATLPRAIEVIATEDEIVEGDAER